MEKDPRKKNGTAPPQTMITSFEIDVALHSEIKIYAARNRMKIKDVVNNALKEYIENKGNNGL